MTCAACGMGDHRYGTTDPHHEPDRMACINILRAEIDSLRIVASDHRHRCSSVACGCFLAGYRDGMEEWQRKHLATLQTPEPPTDQEPT